MSEQQNLSPEVTGYLKDAVAAEATRFDSIRNAAIAASAELDTSKAAAEAVEEVITRYAECYSDNHNVKKDFKDCLFLAYAGSAPITFTPRSNRGKEVEPIHTSGDSALGIDGSKPLSSDNTRRAVTDFKESIGIARAAGGGRAPQTPTAKQNASAMVSFQSMLDTLLSTPENVESLKKILNSKGYNLVKLAGKKAA